MRNKLKDIIFKYSNPSLLVKYLLLKQVLSSDPLLKVFEPLIAEEDTMIDVGAHYGIYTLKMSKLVGRRGTVIASEPNPRAFDYLTKATKGLTNVKLYKDRG